MPRVIIFANGVLDPSVSKVIKTSDIILCADGGANHALSLGLIPHAVIGDFDSLSDESLAILNAKNVELHRFRGDKDKSDLELALEHALTLNPSEMILVCALGNRLIKCLATFYSGHKSYSQIAVSLLDGDFGPGSSCNYELRFMRIQETPCRLFRFVKCQRSNAERSKMAS
jgi:thiamine pyrophosphokinase